MQKLEKIWTRDKKRYGGNDVYKEELKQAGNSYYGTIRKAKRLCWQNFLQGVGAKQNPNGQGARTKSRLDSLEIY